MKQVELLIGGASRGSSTGARFERLNPMTGEVASSAAAATLEDADAAVQAAAKALPAWSALGPGERRTRLLRAATALEGKAGEFSALGMSEIGGAPGWYGFNVKLAAEMLREAAAMTTQIAGEIIPSNVPGNLAMAGASASGGGAGNRSLERAGDPGSSCHCDAAGMRQYGGAEGVRNMPGGAWPDRSSATGVWAGRRSGERADQRAGGRAPRSWSV